MMFFIAVESRWEWYTVFIILIVVGSLKSPSIWNSSSFLDVQGNVDVDVPWQFWKLWASYFIEYPSVWLCWWFLVIRFRLYIFDRNITDVLLCSSCCILSDGTWFQFVSFQFVPSKWRSLLSTRLLHLKVTHIPFVIAATFLVSPPITLSLVSRPSLSNC